MKSSAVLVLSISLILAILSPVSILAKSEDSPSGLYIVEFEEAPLATYAGGVPGLAATHAATRGEAKLDAKSPASRAYLAYIEERQAIHLSRVGEALGRSPKVVFSYRAAANGVAMAISSKEARIVAGLPGVTRVTPDRLLPQDTDRGPSWIGAPAIWDGTATGGAPGTHGEGVIVGVLDSGVNMDHPSFAATGDDSFTHTNPFGAGVFVGWCDPTNPNHDPSYVCNDKLIGAWDFVEAVCPTIPTCADTGGPEDDDGHGSHTASTSAGNILTANFELSGVAPHANLITYDVCYMDTGSGQGLCPFAATSAAVDQAVLDGVDVTNYSIGGGTSPWGGDIDTFFLGAVAAGIFPATSAGNSGPGASTLGHLGPWVATVGASTHDRDTGENGVVDMSGGGLPPADVTGASLTAGYGPAPIVYAADFSNGDGNPEQCLNPFPAGTWTSGEIVLCDRGQIARVQKCINVAAGGAAGCVLGNVAGSGPIVADPHSIPSTHIDQTDADTLRAWLGAGAGHTATITGATIITDPAVADVMASFSSRGPNVSFDVLKPDVTAPGVSILAAVASGGGAPAPEFGVISGTSMSSPHTAGSGALLSALHPTWSPAAIKSALMMTGDTSVLKEDAATPADAFDMGGGRVDLTRAGEVGLVLDETHANFLAADPNLGGQPDTLNLASLQQTCVIECSWTRTFTSVASATTSWTVSSTARGGLEVTPTPSNFTIDPGEEQEVEFVVDISGLPLETFAFGAVGLSSGFQGGPDLRLPIAVNPVLENLPDLLEIDTLSPSGSEILTDRRAAVAITALDLVVSGLTEGTQTTVSLNEDPTNNDAYDDLGQVFFKTISVPAGARRLVATTESDEAPDVDLFVGTGATPSAATEVCTSTTPTASERCDLANPAAGTYWILVQNWEGSASQPDDIDLVDAVVAGVDAGNLTASGPASVPTGTNFDLTLSWDEPSFENNDIWFGVVDVGTDGGSPGNLEVISVDVRVGEFMLFADGFESGNTSAWSSTISP